MTFFAAAQVDEPFPIPLFKNREVRFHSHYFEKNAVGHADLFILGAQLGKRCAPGVCVFPKKTFIAVYLYPFAQGAQ